MRVVLDVNVIVSALLARDGTPATLLRSWNQAEFEFVISGRLLAELARVLAYPKIRERIPPDEARSVVELLERSAKIVEDLSDALAVGSSDPADDYLIAVASGARALLVTGDNHLLQLKATLPILSPREFRALLDKERRGS